MQHSIHIKFFASLKEQVGMAETSLLLAEPMSVERVWQQLSLGPLPNTMLMAINHDYAARDSLVNPGDELAFFPPVTGG